jgi:hypothetical protein
MTFLLLQMGPLNLIKTILIEGKYNNIYLLSIYDSNKVINPLYFFIY